MPTFSIQKSLAFGWNTFKQRPWLFVMVPLVVFAASLAVGLVQTLTAVIAGKAAGAIVQFVLSAIVNVLSSIGIISLYLKAHEDVRAAQLRDLWNPKPFWSFLGTGILGGLLTLLGLILLIVPGVIIGLMIMFSGYLVVDRGYGPLEALKESARITRGRRWHLFLFALALVGINLVGLCALVVGLFVTVPISVLAVIHAYRTLAASAQPAPAAVA